MPRDRLDTPESTSDLIKQYALNLDTVPIIDIPFITYCPFRKNVFCDGSRSHLGLGYQIGHILHVTVPSLSKSVQSTWNRVYSPSYLDLLQLMFSSLTSY
jgi:hypothetical protein